MAARKGFASSPKKDVRSRGVGGKPGRALLLVVVLMIALVSGMFLSGYTTPRLGIDLAGGTSITLTAVAEEGNEDAINTENMNTAVSIIERRVNGLGVSEAEVQTEGDRNIIVNIPKGVDEEEAREQVGTTAELGFRPVLSSASADKPEQDKKKSDDGNESLQTQLDQLDCRTKKARAEASEAAAQARDKQKVVACDTDGAYKYILGAVSVPGRDVSSADAVYDSEDGQWVVQMDFNDAGTEKFADVTEELASQSSPKNQFAIVLDGEIVSAPSVSERLGGGSAEISGSFTQESAEELANILNYGALPLTFKESSVSSVSPTLGGEQLRVGLIAGAIGLALVVAYLVMYYRGLAFIALASLVVSTILTYSIMCLLGPAIGFALNLPAVCGAIAAIGITADSFIVYFERVRDELREGRTLRPAVERAWPRARRTILVSDFVSFLAAAVLFSVTVGKVQGFAFTLGLTTALDVVVVFLFTKPLMTLMARRTFFSGGHAWSGLDPRRLGIRPPLRRGARPVSVPSDAKEA